MVACLPNFQQDMANRVFVDVMNEPDSMGIRWESSGDRPGAQQLYLSTADAIWALTPNQVMFMFEGTGQSGFGLNWGNGFVTDKAVIQSRGLSDANPFFRELVTKPYVDKVRFAFGLPGQTERACAWPGPPFTFLSLTPPATPPPQQVVITPHVYPPTITHATFLGQTLWDQCNTSFGYLQTQGFCVDGECTQFPVLIGETGSAFEADQDKEWLRDFADFINAQVGAALLLVRVCVRAWEAGR